MNELCRHVPVSLDRNPVIVYLAKLAPGSHRTMRAALERLAGLLTGGKVGALGLAWETLGYQHTAALRARLQELFAPASTNKHLSALKGVLKEAWRLGAMTAEAFHRAVDLPSVRNTALPAGRSLRSSEIQGLFMACGQDTPLGCRDAAVLAILYGGGIRRSEAAALLLGDYEPSNGRLTVRLGKGHKARMAYLGSTFRAVVNRWVAIRGDQPGPLLARITRGGRITNRGISPQSIYHSVQRRVKGGAVKSCSPHDLRRSFVSDLLDAGADLSAVRDLAGHASVQTTVRYDRRGEVAKQRAADLLVLPGGDSENFSGRP